MLENHHSQLSNYMGYAAMLKCQRATTQNKKPEKCEYWALAFKYVLSKRMAAIVGICVNDILVMRLKYLSIPASAIHVGWYTSSGPSTWRGKSSVGRIREDTYLPSSFFGMA